MDIDPKDLLEEKERREELELEDDRSKLKLNSLVAITIALIATFMGVCKIKDENIVLEMQKAQSKSIDSWNYYQAKNIRQDVYQSTADQLKLQGVAAGPAQAQYQAQFIAYSKGAAHEKEGKDKVQKEAKDFDKEYEVLHGRHDQFDLEDASLAIAVSLFAITSLTQKKWMYGIAMAPAVGGVIMGIAGIANLNLHPEALMKLLG